jgi:invasion protein IalB
MSSPQSVKMQALRNFCPALAFSALPGFEERLGHRTKRNHRMSFGTRLTRLRAPLGVAAALGLAGALLTPTLGVAQQQQPQQRQQQRPAQPAQQPQRPAQPPIPTQPQDQAQQGQSGPTVVQVKPEPSQTDWTKVCGKDQANNAEICYTTRDFVSDQGQPVMAVAVYDVKGGPQSGAKIVRFLMPLGLLLQPGVRFAVDQGQPTPGRYAICFPNGCFAEVIGIKDDVINQMKRGTNLNVSVQNQVAREVTFQVPLAGFGKAFDGAPIDPKVLEEQQKKLQEELERRSDEMRKKLEQSSASGATPGAAAGTPPKQ